MNNTENNKMVPLSIVIAGIIIALAIYLGGSNPNKALINTQPGAVDTVGTIEPVTDADHILGSKDAEIVVVEYSDFECPFCKVFHSTMHQIVDSYGGKVSWVYRQFPIASLHPRAAKISEGTECAADQGGDVAFWRLADAIFQSPTTVTVEELPAMIGEMGLDVSVFNNCMSSGKFTKHIEEDIIAATKSGARGTPYSVIITKSGKKVPINGAQPFATVKAQIDELLK